MDAKSTTIEFFVAGQPKTAGSKRAFMPKGWARPIIVDDCASSKDWKADVKAVASERWPAPVLHGPLRVEFTFVMPRPKWHYRANGTLKPKAPYWHVSKPDALKLGRAIEDAITGIIWRDDSQIAQETLHKIYGEKIGCNVRIEEIPGVTFPARTARENGAAEGMPLLRGLEAGA